MNKQQNIDHLFRHSYGKMVSILTRIFGLSHIQIIEDAVQDSFYKAIKLWKTKPPDNPEAWLIKAARNRVIDIFRKIKADESRVSKWNSGPATIAIQEVFLPHEIEDSQLRMIFTACHPALSPEDQISFALKTLSGFSISEIATALLKKTETIKKRLTRARKSIIKEGLEFRIPEKHEISTRIHRVHDVVYLLFNEGFHSNNTDTLIQKELCLEAMRLCKILIDRKLIHYDISCALMALMSFHMARIDGKLDNKGNFLTLEEQDRTKWNQDFVLMGNQYMDLAVQSNRFSTFHFEAAIAYEHVIAESFSKTNWHKIMQWYKLLHRIHPSDSVKLNIAIVNMQLKEYNEAKILLDSLKSNKLEQRNYLFHSTLAEFYRQTGKPKVALDELHKALQLVINKKEKSLIQRKITQISI